MDPHYSPCHHSIKRAPRRHRSSFLHLLRQLYREGKPLSHPVPELLHQGDLESAGDNG